jgi:hypothetical protein
MGTGDREMKTIKRAFFGTSVLGAAFILALGSYNTMSVDYSAFTKNDLGIKFSKRLDNITGEVVVGRMAASVPKWAALATAPVQNEVKKIKEVVKEKKIIENKIAEVEKSLPAPIVSEDLDLELTGGFYNKKALKGGEISGSASVVDGVLESIRVTMPDGNSIDINTSKEKMVGNVFQYEDTATAELRTGLFYKVKEGSYMVTLTNDSVYTNMRLELKADGGFENTQKLANWNMGKEEGQDAYEKLVEEDAKAEQLAQAEPQGPTLQEQLDDLKLENERLKEEQQEAFAQNQVVDEFNEVEQDGNQEEGAYSFQF